MNFQVGFYEYGVSPYHLKPFKGFFKPGVANFMKRTFRQAIFIAPPGLAFYFLSQWANSKVNGCHFKIDQIV